MSDPELNELTPGASRDALAELVRAAGRRPQPSRRHYRDVRAAAHAAWRDKVRRRRRVRFMALAASTGVAAALVLAVLGVYDTERAPAATLVRTVGELSSYSARTGEWLPPGDAAMLHIGDRLRTESTGGATVTLAAGDSLRVGAATELRIAGLRTVELEAGTLYVDSGEDSRAGPIEIDTALGRVRDIGTQFEVHRGNGGLRVRVRSGRVELVDSPLGAAVDAPAGAELELAESGALERGSIAPDAPSWGWAAALAVPPDDGASVLVYLEWIARETGKSLRFESESTELRAELVRWRGDVRGLTPMEILDAIVATSDFLYELTRDGSILIRQA